MTILARRFTIICLVMSIFAVGFTMVVEYSDRRTPRNAIGLGAPCTQTLAIDCRIAL